MNLFKLAGKILNIANESKGQHHSSSHHDHGHSSGHSSGKNDLAVKLLKKFLGKK